MSGWWAHDIYHSLGAAALVGWIFWVIFSITLHELGHGWAAIWQGDNTPRLTGHMSFNPLVHMGQWSLIMFAIIGIAWGMMPVNPSRFRNRRWGDALVAAAGPLVNLGLAIITFIVLALWIRYAGNIVPQSWLDPGFQILWTGCALNIILMLFNLLPVPPLDGSRIAAGISWRARELYARPEAQMYGMIALLVLMFPLSGPLFSWVWSTVSAVAVDLASRIP